MTKDERTKIIGCFSNGVEFEKSCGIDAEYHILAQKLDSLLERDTPKAMLFRRDSAGNDYLICPVCSAICSDGDWLACYCPDCGQRVFPSKAAPFCVNCQNFAFYDWCDYGECKIDGCTIYPNMSCNRFNEKDGAECQNT